MGLLDGKVVFITGGAQGMGRAHALASAREGADVVLFDLAEQLSGVDHPMGTPNGLDDTAKAVEDLGRRALSVQGDVRDQDQLDNAVAQAVAELGRIDVLIANAGIWTKDPFWKMSEDKWLQTVDINLNGVWRSAKAVAPQMIEHGAGSIVLTSSINGLEPQSNAANYTASKHGVVGLMRTIALELAPFGIRCNSIHPGAINTAMASYQEAWDLLAGYTGATAEVMQEAAYHFNALKGFNLIAPEAVADAVVFLNSDLARAITGIVVPVDAGHLILPGHNHAPTK